MNPKLSEQVNHKFIDSINIDDWEIETDTGWVDATHIHKTIKYDVYEIILENGLSIKCADTHILLTKSKEEIFAKDSVGVEIYTKYGYSRVVSVKNLGYSENMYDITVDSDEHVYYTNDILSHNTTTNTIYILWYLLFKKDKSVAILANKASTSRSILGRIQLAFELLPNWMKPTVEEWNKGSGKFGNGNSVIAAATSSASIRGESVSLLVIDEAAFVENWDEFYTSTYPTIASGKTTQVVLISTINGLNHYHTIMEKARAGTSDFKPFEVTWRDVPGRDEEWRRQTIANTSEEAFQQEHENIALGSSNTLIGTKYLKQLSAKEPIFVRESVRIYKEPVKDHIYIGVVDTSRGKGLDNSAISIIDVTSYPFEQVATYYNSEISYLVYPEVIFSLAKKYNNAHLLIENNDVGGHICAEMNELEYENIITPPTKNRAKYELGVRTTKNIKAVGCSSLRDLIESQKLIINDKNTILELGSFIRKGTSYQADTGMHDDLVMTLVLFSWLTTTETFQDIVNHNLKHDMFQSQIDSMYEDLLPEIVIDNGVLDNTPKYERIGNENWEII